MRSRDSSEKNLVTRDDQLSPGDLVVIGANTLITGTLEVPMAAGKLSNREMPVVKAVVNGRTVLCLVDTGSGCTMVSARVVVGIKGLRARKFLTADGRTSHEGRECWVAVKLHDHLFKIRAIAVRGLENLGVDCLLGDDVVDHMGGVSVQRGPDSRYVVHWGQPSVNACQKVFSVGKRRSFPDPGGAKPLAISDKDFEAVFANGVWTVSWRWTAGEPKRLQTGVGEYKCTRAPGVHEKYTEEIQSWISKGWLVKWDGPVKGVIPLLAVVQPTKDKVRPVMDYRELNNFVESHTGDEQTAVCADKVRRWRQLRGELKVVDLKSAYLQIHVSTDLWQYQVVRYNGVHYALTRLGFGLSCAPRVMTMILGKVLSMDDAVHRATDHYIDDIMVQESIVSASRVREHLQRYGLESKEPMSLDGGRVLGISLSKGPKGHLVMSRGNMISSYLSEADEITKRGLFSICGRLTGHYPVAGWLRPHCSFLKRLGSEGSWDEPASDSVRKLVNELAKRVQTEDPVKGQWFVNPDGNVTVWTDASSLAMGVAIQVDDVVVEDATWLRKKSDHLHINVSELEAVGRGINLAISWGFKTFTIATDSRTVLSWLDNTIEGYDRVRTKSAAQMLIKRRLMVIKEIICEYKLDVKFRFVSTIENKADPLTRVTKKWLSYHESEDSETVRTVSAASFDGEKSDAIWKAHLPHHLGVDRTFYLVKQFRSDLTRDQVRDVIAGCEECLRIDPAMRAENLVGRGDLAVDKNWHRVAVDVTHYEGVHFLSIVDCGPSRFAIWRRLQNESAPSIVNNLTQVMIEHGPCAELLLDNSTAFRSATVGQFAKEWGINLRFRAAYAPGGNGIVERNHRTIKRIAARGSISPEVATFWYNVTPRSGIDENTVPSRKMFKYSWRVPYDVNCEVEEKSGAFSLGDEVWVKPAVPSCTKRWSLGRVTEIQSKHVICVDGMPRHVRDVRKRRGPGIVDGDDQTDFDPVEFPDHINDNVSAVQEQSTTEEIDQSVSEESGNTNVVETPRVSDAAEDSGSDLRRSGRVHRPPAWLGDYVT